MLASVITTVYQFEWWHLPVGLAIMLIGMSWLGIYAAGFLTALDISRRCANSARSRGLNARFYARIGALYSILSIGLGIYLIRKLQGTPTSSSTIRAYYVILFVAWLAIIGQVPGRGVRVRHPDCTAQAAADCVSGASCSASCFVVTPGDR